MKLTIETVKQDIAMLPEGYKTADIDGLIRKYVREKANPSLLRPYILEYQELHRIYYYTALKQLKDVKERMAFIHENLLFADWWHTDQLIRFVADLKFETAMQYAKGYRMDEDPFIRRWGYVLFISKLGRGHADELLPLLQDDAQYYVQMAEAWLIAELAVYQPEVVYEWFKNSDLHYNITGKAIQKICDSFRISEKWKERYKGLRPMLKKK